MLSVIIHKVIAASCEEDGKIRFCEKSGSFIFRWVLHVRWYAEVRDNEPARGELFDERWLLHIGERELERNQGRGSSYACAKRTCLSWNQTETMSTKFESIIYALIPSTHTVNKVLPYRPSLRSSSPTPHEIQAERWWNNIPRNQTTKEINEERVHVAQVCAYASSKEGNLSILG